MADRKRNMMKEEEKEYEQKTRGTEKLLLEAYNFGFSDMQCSL